MKREEFRKCVKDFVESWDDETGQPTAECPMIDVLIRCRTEGCPRNDDSIQEVSRMPVPFDGVWKNVCGTCGRPVEDLNPQLSDDPDYRLPTRYPDGNSWMVIQ